MRILYFHQYFATRRRSTATRSYELARRLVEAGHVVTVVTSGANLADGGSMVSQAPRRSTARFVSRRTVDGIDLVIFRVPYSNYLSYTRRLGAFVAFTLAASVAGAALPAPDVVFATSTPLTIAIPGMIAQRLKAPLVFEIRDLWPAAHRSGRAAQPPPDRRGGVARTPDLRSRRAGRRPERGRARRPARRRRTRREAGLRAQRQRPRPLSPRQRRRRVPPRARSRRQVPRPLHRRHGTRQRPRQFVDAAAALAHAGRDDIALVAIGDGASGRARGAGAELGLRNVFFLPPVAKHRWPASSARWTPR